jgi:hypothetical protein
MPRQCRVTARQLRQNILTWDRGHRTLCVTRVSPPKKNTLTFACFHVFAKLYVSVDRVFYPICLWIIYVLHMEYPCLAYSVLQA